MAGRPLREWTPEQAAQRDFELLRLVAHADAATQRLYIRRARACAGAAKPAAAAHPVQQQSAKQQSRRALRSAARQQDFFEAKRRIKRVRSRWQQATAAVLKAARFDRLWQVHNDWYAESVRPPPALEPSEDPMQLEPSCAEPREGKSEHQADERCGPAKLEGSPAVPSSLQMHHRARRTRRRRRRRQHPRLRLDLSQRWLFGESSMRRLMVTLRFPGQW